MLNKQTFEEMKSPMYATSVGLLIKGIQTMEDEERLEEEKVTKTPKKTVSEIAERQAKKDSWFTKLISEFIKDDAQYDDDTFIGKK